VTRKILPALALLTTLSFSYDEYIAPKCEPLFQYANDLLTQAEAFKELGDREIGVPAKDAYYMQTVMLTGAKATWKEFKTCQKSEAKKEKK